MNSPSGEVELRTQRLLLRPYRFGDVDDVYAYARDPEWARYLVLAIPQPYKRRNAEEFIAGRVIASWSTNPTFAVVLDSVVIGGINLRIDARHEAAEMGYSLSKVHWGKGSKVHWGKGSKVHWGKGSKVHWGKGLTTEAAAAVVDWGFRELCLAKIYANADLRNAVSWRVMEKIGMTREGVFRSHRKDREGRADHVCYGILREEWKEQERK